MLCWSLLTMMMSPAHSSWATALMYDAEKISKDAQIIGTAFADVCQGTDHSETILGLQDNDILSGNGSDDIVEETWGMIK